MGVRPAPPLDPVLGIQEMRWTPDIYADVTLLRREEGGRSVPITMDTFGCLLVLANGDMHDAKLDLGECGALGPGDSARLPVKFLFSADVLPKIATGARLELWDGRVIGHATVATVEGDA